MKSTCLTLLLFLVCISGFSQASMQRNRFTTNSDASKVDGGNLTNITAFPLVNTAQSPAGSAITNPASGTGVYFLTNGSSFFGTNVIFADVGSHTFLNPSNYSMAIFQGNPNKWLLMLAYSNGVLYHFAPTGFGAIGNDSNDFVYIAVEDGHAQSNALYMIIDPTNGAIIDALSKTGNFPRLNIISASNIDEYAAANITLTAHGGHVGLGFSNFTSQSFLESSNNSGGYAHLTVHNGGGTGGVDDHFTLGENGSVGQSIPNDIDSLFLEQVGAGPILIDDFNAHGIFFAQHRAGVFSLIGGNAYFTNSAFVGGLGSIGTTLTVGGIGVTDTLTMTNINTGGGRGVTSWNGTNFFTLDTYGTGAAINNFATNSVLEANTGLEFDAFNGPMIWASRRTGFMGEFLGNLIFSNSFTAKGQGQVGTKFGIGMAPKDLLDIHGANNGLIMSVVTNDNATSGTDYMYMAQAGTSPGFNNGADIGLWETRGIGGSMFSAIGGPMFFNTGASRIGAMQIDVSQRLWVTNPPNFLSGISSRGTNTFAGFSSFGWTNNRTVSARLIGLTGTAVIWTNMTSSVGVVRGTIVTPIDIILQTNEAVIGTSMAVLTNVAF